MRQRHAKADRSAVVLHVERVMREAECFREVIHDLGVMIEGVRELLRIWPVTVSEARVVGRDKVIVIRESSEEWLEHPRRRRGSVQQEERRRVLRACFPIKDGEPIDLYRAIGGRTVARGALRFYLTGHLP